MKLLLLGKNGQLGRELQRSLAPLGELIALDRNSTNLCGDLTQLEALADTVRSVRPDFIINAAAFTAVDQAETEVDLAYMVNALAPGVLAAEAAKLGACLIHYSTDYVFDGSGSQAWLETDVSAPLNIYGKTKLEGERLVALHSPKHFIFRTSWVYGVHGNNFIKTMLKLAQEREYLEVINDQFGAPTGADLLADISVLAIKNALQHNSGIYHLAAGGETTWFDYANYVLSQATKKIELRAVASSAFPRPALRPSNSRLDSTKLQKSFNISMPPWQQGVDRMLAKIL